MRQLLPVLPWGDVLAWCVSSIQRRQFLSVVLIGDPLRLYGEFLMNAAGFLMVMFYLGMRKKILSRHSTRSQTLSVGSEK